MTSCLLCHSESTAPYFGDSLHKFFECFNCGTVFRDPANFPSPSEERERYLTHNNDVNDPGYQEFVSPITEAVQKYFTKGATGLDFGAGTGPVIAKVLGDHGYAIELYDPFFHPDREVLNKNYDFIVCCEVIEHFHRPQEEFLMLRRLLKPGGRLFCMTDPLPEVNFDKWYYKDDPTHVIFYSEENLTFIKEDTGFAELITRDRLIIFSI
ncbi:class I SAM-dependent methyltransferase [Aureitalea sp. L0-47]|uniref:class I SAM-dependent methyltransferase n=1 Tax=Aureitalea sp. L0-47 TaxID=2816962 RepID=UPI0022375BF8|nr:class I SAM-dependent methyltransferase [Aureitalea sp. L0-47]MCW5520350.1 class I SAM-dependent methyltransferase [Aureitalea sp. L0-47]